MAKKPEIIRRLEKKTGRRLEEMRLEEIRLSSTNGYAVDEAGQVVGLNFFNAKLPDISFLAEEALQGLTYLQLSFNQLTDISPLQGLNALKELRLSNNQLTDISPLQGLILRSGIQVKWAYDGGRGIFLEYNPLETPPVEVVKQGTEAVRNYFQEIAKASVLLLESKLLIVGNGDVGKTTLMRKLKDNNFKVEVGKEPTTEGIKIEPWQLKCPFVTEKGGNEKVKTGETVTVHFWDFGGQEIYHSTHQFFLTKRSLYLFVWEARKEEDTHTFNYWFNIIKLLSDESPVIVVMNKSDIRLKHLDESRLMKKFTNIAGFFQVSCLKGDGIAELTGQIRSTLARMPHLQDRLPTVWKEIRDKLKNDTRNYISLEDYFALCWEFHMNRERAMFLSSYLHDLGVILHYQDILLKHTVILDPEWATEAVYTLIDTRQIQENKGRFQFKDLENYWDSNKFPPGKHAELIRLMEKFELCFNLAGSGTHIIPELLPPEQPGVSFDLYHHAPDLRFRYQYDFMPDGILSRFISRVYYLVKDEHFWKSGVELTFEKTTALVAGDPIGREMTIALHGPNPGELLAIIRNELDHIHRTLNMEKERHYDEEIPCICSQCKESVKPYLFKYEIIKRRREKNRDTIDCGISVEEVSIERLLRGVEPVRAIKELDLTDTLIEASRYLQGIAKSIHRHEDNRNDFITAMLTVKGFHVKDQTRWGASATGKTIGRLDFKVQNPETREEAIVEAFNLKSVEKAVIQDHLTRLFKYDANGLPRNFILV
ncbi:MAG: GTP-binding protein, partial [bacterium]|nr:GTP-binding protein [bacterium]